MMFFIYLLRSAYVNTHVDWKEAKTKNKLVIETTNADRDVLIRPNLEGFLVASDGLYL